jgi:predicted phage terminase large subunit-like protein
MVDREAVAAAARDELARRHLADFGALMVPSYERARHVELLCEHLEALERGEIQRLVVSEPPRHSTSLHVTQLLPAWWLGRHPRDRISLASYGAELAEAHSRRARGFVANPRWPFETAVAGDSSAVNRWDVRQGGGVIAAGVSGALTGHGAHLLVVDDPVKDREAADSAAIRESTWRWWSEVALTRLQPGARVCVTGTRWHADDLIGRILTGAGAHEWTVLTLPAIAEVDDPLGRAEGEALWPEWYDVAHLETLRGQIGERPWQALYQQTPTPTEGALFKRAWLEGRYDQVPDGVTIVTAVDASFGKSVASDYSAIVTVAGDGRDIYVLHAARGRWAFNELCEQVKREARDWNPNGPILLEDAAAGQSAIQELRRTTGLNVIPVKPDGSKLARAEAASPAFESGRVFFPSKMSRWRDELIEEVASFPAGKNDDYTDALVYAVQRLRPVVKSGGTVAGVVTSNGWLRDSQRRAADRQSRDATRRRRQALRLPRGLFDPRYS